MVLHRQRKRWTQPILCCAYRTAIVITIDHGCYLLWRTWPPGTSTTLVWEPGTELWRSPPVLSEQALAGLLCRCFVDVLNRLWVKQLSRHNGVGLVWSVEVSRAKTGFSKSREFCLETEVLACPADSPTLLQSLSLSPPLSACAEETDHVILYVCIHMPTARRLWGALTKTTQEQSRESRQRESCLGTCPSLESVHRLRKHVPGRAVCLEWESTCTSGGTSRTVNS